MYSKTKKLLTTRIDSSVIYEVALKIEEYVLKVVDPNNRLEQYSNSLNQAIGFFVTAFTKDNKHPLTAKIGEKHTRRTNHLTALRRYISAAQKEETIPEMVEAADFLKSFLKRNDLWKGKRLSHPETTKIVDIILRKASEEPFVQHIETVGINGIIDRIRMSQEEYNALFNDRLMDKTNDMAPKEYDAYRDLINVVMATLVAINFHCRNESEVFAELAGQVSKLIIRANINTRAQISQEDTGNGDSGDDDSETEEFPFTELSSQSDNEADAVVKAGDVPESDVEGNPVIESGPSTDE